MASIKEITFGKNLRPSTVEAINKIKVTLYTPLTQSDEAE